MIFRALLGIITTNSKAHINDVITEQKQERMKMHG